MTCHTSMVASSATCSAGLSTYHTMLLEQLDPTVPHTSAAAQQHHRRNVRQERGKQHKPGCKSSLLLHRGKGIWEHDKAAEGRQTGQAVLSRSMLAPESWAT